MRRKYRRLRKKENIIAFPGTFEKLVETGARYVELEKYDEAVKAFDQAFLFEPDHPEFLGPYAVALYEAKQFQRAKDIATQLLHSGTANYMDAMELYLTISIQLQEYDEVEMTIDTLIEEGIVPQELLPKFTYLRDLNSRLAARYPSDRQMETESLFTFDEFVDKDPVTQQHMLASLEGTDLRAMQEVLANIAQSVHFTPLVITFALTLLHQANYRNEVTVHKLGEEMTIIPATMTLPGQDEQTQEVLTAAQELLDKDPTRLEMAQNLIEKFAITAFPFGWGDYGPEEIVDCYVHYIESLFTEASIPDTPLCQLIEKVDKESDFDKS